MIRIFHNEGSAMRLIGALPAEIHEDRQQRPYLDMGGFHDLWEATGSAGRENKVLSISH